MTYQILDLDLEPSHPIPTVEPSPEREGIAVLVRRGGVPVSFFLHPLTPSAGMSSEQLSTLIHRRAGLGLVRAAIREELAADPVVAALDLTVAVCTRERPEWLRDCLRSLTSLDPAGSHLEVLVVDNAPTSDRTRQVAAAFPEVRYLREPVAGLDVARNRALTETTTTYLAFVDDDVVVDPGWLQGMSATWSRNPEADAVTGLVLPYELETRAQVLFEQRGGFRRGMEERRFAAGNGYRSNHPFGAGGFGTGANMAFRTAALRELGGFDPALDTGRPLPGGGDLDAFYRVLVGGRFLVYAPGAVVWHRHRRTIPELRRQYWTWGSGYLAFLHRTFRQQPARRRQVARAAAWWLRREVATTWSSLRGRDPAPPSVAAASLVGGLVTAPWKYPSSTRVERPEFGGEG